VAAGCLFLHRFFPFFKRKESPVSFFSFRTTGWWPGLKTLVVVVMLALVVLVIGFFNVGLFGPNTPI
jgi:hypothetical protein